MRVRSSCTVSSRIGALAARSATPRVGRPPDQKNASIAALAQRDHGGVEPDVAGLEVLVRVDARARRSTRCAMNSTPEPGLPSATRAPRSWVTEVSGEPAGTTTCTTSS